MSGASSKDTRGRGQDAAPRGNAPEAAEPAMQEDEGDDDEAAMQAMMGFGGFGTTQVSITHSRAADNTSDCCLNIEQAHRWKRRAWYRSSQAATSLQAVYEQVSWPTRRVLNQLRFSSFRPGGFNRPLDPIK